MAMNPDTIRAIKARLAETHDERARTRALIAAGRWSEAEQDATRATSYKMRVDRLGGHREATRGSNDFQRVAFLSAGLRAKSAVAHVRLEIAASDGAGGESRSGTGFLISPELFITNQHVINNANDAALAQIVFDDELDDGGKQRPTTIFSLDPAKFFISSPEEDLDFALVAIGVRIAGAGVLADFGYCPLSKTPDREQLGVNANIVQHPNMQKKLIVIRNNYVVARRDAPARLYYETDTEEGSSGSPVFNDLWDVIALHHYGEAAADVTLADGARTRSVNEGVRISAIYDALGARLDALSEPAKATLSRALVLWKTDAPADPRIVARPRAADPDNAAHEAVTPPAAPQAAAAPLAQAIQAEAARAAAPTIAETPRLAGERAMPGPSAETRIVVPLEISIRIGASGGQAAGPAAALPKLASAPRLAESAKIDRDYSNRNGFDPAFVPGIAIDLDDITAPQKKKIAPLHEDEKKRANGELAYQNFSVVMHKTNRVAMLTATNIDGPSYIEIDRKTGEAAATQPRPEGDSWFTDPRISDSYILTNDFYGNWSHIFDRGHLTRRNDPTWGGDAARANKDTFHFTNCSPQHWKFNESIEFWQGVERYVLEQGLWATGFRRRLTVLQGPLFDGAENLYADDTPISCAFWKIVVWKGQDGLKAVALIVDQTNLLSITRQGGAPPPDDAAAVHVDQFRSSVAEVARRSGLDFGEIGKYDTAKGDLPHVGEARRLLTDFSQLNIR